MNLQPKITENEDGSIEVEVNGRKFFTKADGSVRVVDQDGKVTSLDTEGNLNFSAVKRVEIENLALVTEHVITSNGNDQSQSHALKFVGGGHCTVTFDQNGAFATMQSTLMQVQKTNDDRLILKGTAPPESRLDNPTI